MKTLLLALLALASPALAEGEDGPKKEGVTGVVFAPPRLSPNQSWDYILGRAWAEWPSLPLADRQHYLIEGLCVDGPWLRNFRRERVTLCVLEGEGHCAQSETLDLKVPLGDTPRVYDVAVWTGPHGRFLFKKTFTIPLCK